MSPNRIETFVEQGEADVSAKRAERFSMQEEKLYQLLGSLYADRIRLRHDHHDLKPDPIRLLTLAVKVLLLRLLLLFTQ